MSAAFDKNPTRSLKCLLGVITAVKNNATKFCIGRILNIRLEQNFIDLTIEKGRLIVTYGRIFGYKFLYDEEKNTFNVFLLFLHVLIRPILYH